MFEAYGGGLFYTPGYLVFNCQRNFDGRGPDGFEQQRANDVVNWAPTYRLTRLASLMRNGIMANVVWLKSATDRLIPDAHAPATHAADYPTLQQTHAVTGHRASRKMTEAGCALLEGELITLVFLPAEVTRVSVADQYLPFGL